MEDKLLCISLDLALTGRQIYNLMIKNGYTVKKLQELLGLACPQSVYKWIHGKTLPSVDNLYRMSKIFHVHIEEMLVENKNNLYDNGFAVPRKSIFSNDL